MEDDLLEVDDNFDVDEYEYKQQLEQRENPFSSDVAMDVGAKSLQQVGQGGAASTFFKVASIFSHLGAILSFALVLTLIHMRYLPDGGYHNLKFGDFALHPILMGTAFGLFMPLGVMSYSTWEYWFGLSHGAAKALHALFHSAAVLFGSVGIASMWKTHESVRHFQTVSAQLFPYLLAVTCIARPSLGCNAGPFVDWHRCICPLCLPVAYRAICLSESMVCGQD